MHHVSLKGDWLYLSRRVRSTNLLVSELRQPILGSNKQLALVETSELSINIQVLLIKDLQTQYSAQRFYLYQQHNMPYLENGVEQTRQRRIVRLLDHLSTSPLGIVLRDD